MAEMERVETAARLAMAHDPESGTQAFSPSSVAEYYLRLCSVTAVVIVSGVLGFTAF